ncbi:Carboxypeptidase G2 precursor [Lacunisphaera limnophila]|uniref:Carboxypeptidase G2 n=1 Tax=Lacunisphaera limnophila TaxID=1838286 RepID=A0A1I7PHT4_9BACT|nr:hydrolase [Lacunisphaera limnophila]AOS43178.1 Carboxypeptidase G2 precursor [Lacunisphaera limnophila]
MPVPDPIAALPKRASELRDLLIKWCNQNSGSASPAGLAAMLKLLQADFGRLGSAEAVPLADTTAQALRLRVRPTAPLQLLLSGHYDTVYDADHPFQACTLLSPERLRGPGTADMKGGLVVMLAALLAFEKTPHAAKLGYEILLGPDEETGSQGTAPLLEEAATRHRFALVFEPARANGDLVKSRKGTGIFTLTCHGRAAHAGRAPEAGRNAILALCDLLPRVEALTAELPGVMVNVGAIRGGGAANIVPDFAEAVINVRVTAAGDDATFLRRLHAICAPWHAREGYRIEIGGGFNRGPKVETPAETALFTEWRKGARELGLDFDWQHVGGGSDGNLLSAAGLPNLDGLGCVGDHLHSPEEFCHLPSLTQRAQVAARFLHRVAAGEIPLPTRA